MIFGTVRFCRNLFQLLIVATAFAAFAGTRAFSANVPVTTAERAPAVRGALPGGPVFNPNRPKPTLGNVLEIESLTNPPPGFTMQRRNNFYKPDNSDGLYRWAASGHWSNYDESKTGDWKKSIPDPLVLQNGQRVMDAETWDKVRRPEILSLFESALHGKVPANLPKIIWTATKPTNENGTITTTATGRYVNNDGTPFAGARGSASGTDATPPDGARGGRFGGRGGGGGGLNVTYTIPANAPGAVPLVQGGNAQQVLAMGFGTVAFGGGAPNVSTGQPDDWAALRKSAWVVSRGLDYLETDKSVDAHQVALTGHSRGGKEALIRGAFDQRIGLVFASCSGEMGASMSRHDWGETIDDLAQLYTADYCGNFQKWVAHWDEMPVDAHMLVALMAPRPLLITGGTQDQWSDPVGVFWAGVFGGPVYKLLGAKDLGTTEVPQPNTFIGENLVFHDHIGGHMPMPSETAKYMEMIKTYFKVKPAAR